MFTTALFIMSKSKEQLEWPSKDPWEDCDTVSENCNAGLLGGPVAKTVSSVQGAQVRSFARDVDPPHATTKDPVRHN